MSFAHLTASTENSNARQAALLLHSMQEADRRWVLASLPHQERAHLNELITELAQLGIAPLEKQQVPAIASVRQTAPATAPIDPKPVPVTDTDYWTNLEVQGLRTLAQVLRREPPGLTAKFLRLRDWPWKPRLLAQLHASYRTQVEALLNETSAPITAESALAKALESKLRAACEANKRETPPAVAMPKETGFWWHPLKWIRPIQRRING